LTDEAHPLDAYVRQSVATADAALSGLSRRWVFADLAETCFVDFRRLAEHAGLGVRGRLELLLDPEVGPWLGLRAACFVDAPLPVDGPLRGWDPCGTCAAAHPEGVPCARGCPGGAFPHGALDIRACVGFRGRESVCASRCASRRACPIGADRAYSGEQERYHMDPASGRSALSARIGARAEEET
jgi:epoxyqueuosine reductase QueG